MAERELDAVVVRSGQNVTYLSGVVYPGTLARHLDMSDSRRGVAVVWPLEGEPIIVYDSIAAGPTERDAAIARRRVFDGYNGDLYSELVAVLASEGLAEARVGLERNVIAALDWDFIARALPKLRLSDCSDLMDRARWVKTEEEIALIRYAADRLDECYLEVLPRTRAGDTERAVHARMVQACIEKGAGWAHGILNSSRNNVIYCGEGDTALAIGDVIRTDYVAYFRGYPGHQNRNAVLGAPSTAQKSAYATYRDLYRRTIERCRPGVRVRDLFAETVASFARRGWTYAANLIGHSIGPWWHQQPPVLTRTSDVVLEAGMVLAIEPFVDYWHIQDLVLLHAEGAEVLSTRFDTSTLLVVG
jgi:Xaa-Pro aminopeptidase